MSSNTGHLVGLTRIVSIAALLGTTVLAGAAGAQPMPGAATPVTATSMDTKRETVEERISGLHDALQITAGEESSWATVAQTMRDNDDAMKSMVAERAALDPASITAVDDLKSYERFAKAHVRGLKKLIVSFESLYAAMPDQQKHLADHVLKTFGHDQTRASN